MSPALLDAMQIVWDYMRYDQPLEKADVILCLGSYDIRSADWAAKLWHDGWAPTILFSGNQGAGTMHLEMPEAKWFAERAIELGVPRENILLEDRSCNTGENFQFSSELLQREGITHDTIILVTKPYMLRRAYATCMQQWPEDAKPRFISSGIDLTMEAYLAGEAYGEDLAIQAMLGDLQRIREYPKLGFSIAQEIPDDVWDAYEELVAVGYNDRLLKDAAT